MRFDTFLQLRGSRGGEYSQNEVAGRGPERAVLGCT